MHEIDTREALDGLEDLREAIREIAVAITSPTAGAGHDAFGGRVESLTEAVMGMAQGLQAIAVALDSLAAAVADRE